MSNTNTQGAVERIKQALRSINKKVSNSLSFIDASSITPDDLMDSIRVMREETVGMCTDTTTHRHCLNHFA